MSEKKVIKKKSDSGGGGGGGVNLSDKTFFFGNPQIYLGIRIGLILCSLLIKSLIFFTKFRFIKVFQIDLSIQINLNDNLHCKVIGNKCPSGSENDAFIFKMLRYL